MSSDDASSTPEAFRAQRREVDARYRERVMQSGLTFHELWLRVGGDRSSLVTVLNSELALGRLDFNTTTRRSGQRGAPR